MVNGVGKVYGNVVWGWGIIYSGGVFKDVIVKLIDMNFYEGVVYIYIYWYIR